MELVRTGIGGKEPASCGLAEKVRAVTGQAWVAGCPTGLQMPVRLLTVGADTYVEEFDRGVK